LIRIAGRAIAMPGRVIAIPRNVFHRGWRKKQDVVLRQEQQPSEKGFVDWAGATIPVHDPVSGEIRQARCS
jgi:transposase